MQPSVMPQVVLSQPVNGLPQYEEIPHITTTTTTTTSLDSSNDQGIQIHHEELYCSSLSSDTEEQ